MTVNFTEEPPACNATLYLDLNGNGKYRHVLCVIMSKRRVSMVPTRMLCNLYTYAPYLPNLCGNLFMTF